VLGGVSEEELDVKELIGVVGREPVPGRDTCNGRVEVPGAEEGWEEYNPAFVTEGDRRRVGKGGARDILDRLRMVVVMFKHKSVHTYTSPSCTHPSSGHYTSLTLHPHLASMLSSYITTTWAPHMRYGGPHRATTWIQIFSFISYPVRSHGNIHNPGNDPIFTGNPGLVDFYIPFLSRLYTQYSSSNLAIVGRGHLGHCPQIQATPKHQPEESLKIQIQTSLEVLDAISTFYANTRIVVVGHSVGAWLALQVSLPLSATACSVDIYSKDIEKTP